ncbi:serine proteinase protein 1, partial [Danaus plexippus plexippus]
MTPKTCSCNAHVCVSISLIVVVSLVTRSFGANISFPNDKLDEANEWLNRVYEMNSTGDVLDRF